MAAGGVPRTISAQHSSSGAGAPAAISQPLTNCATVEPNRPTAASTAMADARWAVGKVSAEMQSRAFHADTDTKLNRHTPPTTSSLGLPGPTSSAIATPTTPADAAAPLLRPPRGW